MLELLTTSTLPLSLPMLAALLEYRMKKEVLDVYKADLLWSFLKSFCASRGAEIELVSYSEVWREVFLDETSPKRKTAEDIRAIVTNMLNKFG